MAETNIDSAVASDLKNVMTDFSVQSETTDAATGEKETVWSNEKFNQYLGYYKTIPELQAAIDAKATWTVGKGFIADETTTLLLDTIKGWGADTFNTIIENMIRTYNIGGDAFCEIIEDDEGNLINLKPLDPAVITIVVDGNGIIKRYEQTSKTKGNKEIKKLDPEQIFHLARNRVADEIHGVSMIRSVEGIILARNEAMADYKTILHRFAVPRWIISIDEDDDTKIAAFKRKMDKANADGENMYVPKGVVELEQMTIAPNSTLNPQAWIELLNKYFFQAVAVPQFIVGGGTGFTEASEKIAYLAFQQTIEEEQLFVEENILSQLNLVIELEFPASLENELLSDNKKDGAVNMDRSEVAPTQTQ